MNTNRTTQKTSTINLNNYVVDDYSGEQKKGTPNPEIICIKPDDSPPANAPAVTQKRSFSFAKLLPFSKAHSPPLSGVDPDKKESIQSRLFYSFIKLEMAIFAWSDQFRDQKKVFNTKDGGFVDVNPTRAPTSDPVTQTGGKTSRVYESVMEKNEEFESSMRLSKFSATTISDTDILNDPGWNENYKKGIAAQEKWFQETLQNAAPDQREEIAQGRCTSTVKHEDDTETIEVKLTEEYVGKCKKEFCANARQEILTGRVSEHCGKFLDRCDAVEGAGPVHRYIIAGSYIADLQNFSNKLETEGRGKDKADIDRLISTLKETETISHDLLQVKHEAEVTKSDAKIDTDTGKIADQVKERLKNLAIGEKLVIQGGPASHAVMYEFVKTSEDKFVMNIINTGDGAPTLIFDTRTRTKETENLCIQDIPQNLITEGDFMKELLLFTTSPKGEKTMFGQNSMTGIHTLVQKTLVGSDADEGLKGYYGRPPDSYPFQRHQSCFARCMSQFIAQNLDKKLNKEFEIDTLERHAQDMEALSNQTQMRLIQKGRITYKTIDKVKKMSQEELARMTKEREQMDAETAEGPSHYSFLSLKLYAKKQDQRYAINRRVILKVEDKTTQAT